MINNLKNHTFFSVYLLGFIFAFHVALSTYVNSSFLSTFVPENMVGTIYTLGSFLTIFLFFLTPWTLRKFGNYKLALSLITLEMLALVGLIFSTNAFWAILSFIISFVTVSIFYFSLDIFLEGISRDRATGRIRGMYLTAVNLGWIFAPLISGLVLASGGYWKVYTASLILLIPSLIILMINLKKFKDSTYVAIPVWQTIRVISHNKNLRNIFCANFLLHFFYALMVIYTPIYLHKYVGFSWEQIGLIFGIMLLPFVFIQLPLGILADKRFGEKEILSIGFIIMAIATATLSFLPIGTSLWLWAIILLVTRIGAATVEVMSNTYFFKKVDSLNSDTISLFRTSGPFAYILGPLLVTAMLGFFSIDLKYLFLILGLIMFIGLKFSLSLKDTK